RRPCCGPLGRRSPGPDRGHRRDPRPAHGCRGGRLVTERPPAGGARDGSTVLQSEHDDDRGPRHPSAGRSGDGRGRGGRQRPRWVAPMVLVLVIGLLGAIVGVADTAARRHAEAQVAGRMQAELQLTEAPQVRIGGLLFLGQCLRQHLDTVRVTADTATVDVDGARVELQGVDLWLYDLSSDDWFDTATVGRLEGAGLATWPSVTTLVGEEIAYSEPDDQGRGRVAITQRLQFKGLDLPITLTG